MSTKGLELQPSQTKLKFSQDQEFLPKPPCWVTGFKSSSLRSVCRTESKDGYTTQPTNCLDADLGGWDVTGQSYFAAIAVSVKFCLMLFSWLIHHYVYIHGSALGIIWVLENPVFEFLNVNSVKKTKFLCTHSDSALIDLLRQVDVLVTKTCVP